MTIKNPILKGFNPDPSIIRVGGDYYIATSTFEWFPGVQIHHSKDLIHWTLIARPLSRKSQLDLIGCPDSCGVWAPCLSYDNGIFYLVYSNVRSFDGPWKDAPNYLVTTNDIRGEWSDPIFLSGVGFDGSLFHDTDGKKWFTSLRVDHRNGKLFGGIVLQEYSDAQRQLIGPMHSIFQGSEIAKTEGPHLYNINGYYYLVTAEGGTEYGHAMSIARSKSITGPYELHPNIYLVSSRSYPKIPLQKAGHGDLVQTEDGRWFTVFLVGRPLSERGKCMLGRETAIEEVVWKEDDWPYLKSGLDYPRMEIPLTENVDNTSTNESELHVYTEHHAFDSPNIPFVFQSLRQPFHPHWISLSARPGYLRLIGKESLSSFHSSKYNCSSSAAF